MSPERHQDLKPRSKSGDNVRVIEMRKERSRNAARSRRGKENAQFDELAKLLPLPAAITSQLDKASIIRLTISYLSMREFSGTVPDKMKLRLTDGLDIDASPSDQSSDLSSTQPSTSQEVVTFDEPSTSTGISELLSETGSQLLHVELTGNSAFNYIHQEDHADILEQLTSSVDMPEGSQFNDQQGLFSCQGHRGDPLFNQGEEIKTPTILPHQPRSFFLRMKCTLVRRGGSYTKSAGFKVVHCVGRVKEYSSDKNEAPRRAFVVLAQPVPTMNINELPLECNMFVSRVNMDLKIVYCEGRIHRFMDYLAKDIVGISAYDFYHAGDVALIQGHHAKFLSKGQVWTKYYRWMNKNGGWVWMQTKASLIPHPSNPALKQMLCLNYILSEVEHRSVVLGMAQLENKPTLTSNPQNILTEMPCDGDNSGELNDALIDDQVMVFPKWQATSDKLVPQQTLLDQIVLERTGYTQQFNEAYNNWSKDHPKIDRKRSQTSESETADFDEKELQDIADIISADITPFDHSLLDFVVSGSNPAPTGIQSSHLGPIGGYIEDIPFSSSSTIVTPKVERPSSNLSLVGTSQSRKRTLDNTLADNSMSTKVSRLSHMEATATPQYSDNQKTLTNSVPAGYQLPNQYAAANHAAVSGQSSSFLPGNSQDMRLVSLNGQPKSLLDQLIMMPGSTKEDELLNDDLLEFVEELIDTNDMSIGDQMGSLTTRTVGSTTANNANTFITLQNVKQEVGTATSASARYAECLQNPSKQPSKHQLGGLYHNITVTTASRMPQGNTFARPDRHPQQSLNVPQQQFQIPDPKQAFLPQRQQQFRVSNTAQSSLSQQQSNAVQQLQNPGIKRPRLQQQSQQQQQTQQQLHQLSQPFLQQQNPQRIAHSARQTQLQQQLPPELMSIAEQSEIFRELNELIKLNNSTQLANQSQRVTISTAPLPELSNVIDEELNNLPSINNQNNSINNTQNYNGAEGRNFTGMM